VPFEQVPANCAKEYFQPSDVLEFREVFSLGMYENFPTWEVGLLKVNEPP
jgi:hypothetical protein